MTAKKQSAKGRGARKRAKRRRKRNWADLRDDLHDELLSALAHIPSFLGGAVYLLTGAAIVVYSDKAWSLLGFEGEHPVLSILEWASAGTFLLKGLSRYILDTAAIYAETRKGLKRRLNDDE